MAASRSHGEDGRVSEPAGSTCAAELPIGRLWHAAPVRPTIDEIWLRLLETYRG
jgi:hypothetical protein